MAWYNDIIDTGFRILTQSPVQVIAPMITQTPKIINQTVSPYIRPAIQTVQRVPQILARPPAQVLAPLAVLDPDAREVITR